MMISPFCLADIGTATAFGVKIIDVDSFLRLLVHFAFNFLVILVLARVLYYHNSRRKDYLFSYLLISTIIFLLCYLLSNVKLQLGFALGLFAVFGILRYRTDAIPIKEMTYLFVIIGISVINALSSVEISYAELLFTNILIIGLAWSMERIWLSRHVTRKVVDYEKIELIKPENRKFLIQDLEERTGLHINRIEIGKIDFLKETVRILVYYYDDENREFSGADDPFNHSVNNDDDDD
ncbi:MAG: DUF4956 domain-containing protein [Bacteroidota bacterium]|nr:DUF4956 domain-containing protein [Bacteroidota bacterium]